MKLYIENENLEIDVNDNFELIVLEETDFTYTYEN